MTLKITTSLLAGAITLALPMMATAQTGSRTAPGGSPETPAAVSPFAPLATITESFDVVPGTDPNKCPAGWICSNVSATLGSTNWFQGNPAVFAAQAGAGYIGANFNNTTGTNTISNWLITPVMQFGAGSELRFWARTTTTINYADRLEIRASTGGSSNGGTPTSTGDFSILLGTINPSEVTATGTCGVPAGAPNAGGFPNVWCEYLLTNANGIPNSGSGRIAFRYFVNNGGPTGANSNYIGIDTFSFVEGALPLPITSAPVSGTTLTLPQFTLGGTATTATVTFTNPEASIGTVTCVAPGAPEFTVAPLVINVPATGSAAATISFSSAVVGAFSSALNCTGPNGEVFSFPLVGNAIAGAAPSQPVPALGDTARWLLLFGVLGLGAFAARRRWA